MNTNNINRLSKGLLFITISPNMADEAGVFFDKAGVFSQKGPLMNGPFLVKKYLKMVMHII